MSEQVEPIGVLCRNCGSSWTDERLAEERAKRPELRSCCPERKMIAVYPASYVSDLEARLEKAEAERDGWQPIETAPKGTMKSVLITGEEGTEMVFWSMRVKRWLSLDGNNSYNCKPTHWCPLPSPPTPDQGGER